MEERKKFKVLFIDDEPASLLAFKSVFRDFYQVFTASSAEEGYEVMKNNEIHIVISDQRMPGVTGVDFLQRIRIEYPDTVRMLVTGYSDIDAVIRSINGSMISYYFSKPYSETAMKAILDSAIDKIKLLKENQLLLEKLQKMVDELTIAHEQAQESSRLKSSLLANLNHEFRTPMNSILGFSQILRETLPSQEFREQANYIYVSGNRLLKTLNGIVVLAQFEADNTLPDVEDIDLSDLTGQILDEYKDSAGRKKIALTSHISDNVHASFNKAFANLIISNLVDNALKFTSQGAVDVYVDEENDGQQSYGLIRVTDTGIGIPETQQGKVFEEFFQISAGYGRSFEGLGIGLALCKKILDRLGGRISMHPRSGGGTEFRVHFPVKVLQSKTAEPGFEHDPSVAGEQAPSGTDMRRDMPLVLMVEDNSYNMELMTLYLRRHYRLDRAFDGETALKKASETHYDAVLMDINLGPGIDGVEAMKQIREMQGYGNVPIIAVTGYDQASDKQNFLTRGFTAFLPKPFTRTDLLRMLDDILSA